MGKNVVEVEQKLLKVVPKEFKVDVHHWLILQGRYTCVARKPRCGACIVEDLCEFKDKTEQSLLNFAVHNYIFIDNHNKQ